jgi:hypothetical protein
MARGFFCGGGRGRWLGLALLLLSGLLLLAAGCATKDVRVKRATEIPAFRRVAVMPFDVTFCRRCADSYPTCRPVGDRIVCDRIKNDIGYRLALSLAREIAIYGKYEVVEPEAAARVLPLVGQVPLREIGRRLGVEMIIFGSVFRYLERIGGPMSVKRPASIYFEVTMHDARTGRKVWYAVFDQTQKSLSADITNLRNFMRGGGRWLTADEFAEVGIAQMVERFPGLIGMKVH